MRNDFNDPTLVIHCEVCGSKIGSNKDVFFDPETMEVMCSSCFSEEFDNRFSLLDKAEMAGVAVYNAGDLMWR